MTTIYNLLEDKKHIQAVHNLPQKEFSQYRTKWGKYGTQEWWSNLKNANLIRTFEGKITRLYMSGHNDFPEFEISNGASKYSFARVGNEKLYQIGANAIVECTELINIRPMSSMEGSMILLSLKVKVISTVG